MRPLITALCLVSVVSFAQQPEPAPKSPKAPVQNIEFTPSEVSGGREGPALPIYAIPPRAKFGCLIQVRMNMNDKLAESVHEM